MRARRAPSRKPCLRQPPWLRPLRALCVPSSWRWARPGPRTPSRRCRQRPHPLRAPPRPPPTAGKHRDAFPDEGSDEQRRVTAVVFCNADWEREHGGVFRLWPPQKLQHGASSVGQPPQQRRSPAGSEAGTSEYSGYSLRSAMLAGHFSTTSSIIAEASLHEHDACSVDNVSLAESEQVERLGLDWVEVEGQMVLEAAPLAGRLVLFLSGAVEHAVMPCHGEMVTVSAWCQ